MTKMRSLMSAVAMCSALSATAVLADPPPTNTELDRQSAVNSLTPPRMQERTVAVADAAVPDPDTKTLLRLHHGNQMEIQMGKIAEEKGTDKGVKDFGKKMVKDHTAMDKDVMARAKDKKVELTDPPPAGTFTKEEQTAEKADMDKLAPLTGSDWDREYMNGMVADHAKDIEEVKGAIDTTTDKKMKSSLQSTLGKMQDHKKMADKWVAKNEKK